MANKIINTLIVLTGPVIMALTQVWQIFVPAGLQEGLISFFNLLLIVLGGTATVFFSIPAAIRLAPRRFAHAFNHALGLIGKRG